MSGLSSCILRMLLACRTVSGKSKVRTTAVSIMMASHHGTPQPWKVVSVAPSRLKSGSKRFLRVSIVRVPSSVAWELSGMRGYAPLLRRLLGWQGGARHARIGIDPTAEAGEEHQEGPEKERDKQWPVFSAVAAVARERLDRRGA